MFSFASRPRSIDCSDESLKLCGGTEEKTCPAAGSQVFPKAPSANLLTFDAYICCSPFITDRYAGNNQFCSTHLELSIMPIHGGDKETCVSSMTFIIAVV